MIGHRHRLCSRLYLKTRLLLLVSAVKDVACKENVVEGKKKRGERPTLLEVELKVRHYV